MGFLGGGLIARRRVVGECGREASQVLFAKGDVVADARGQSHLGHATKLVERVLPAPRVLVLFRLAEEFTCNRQGRIARPRARDIAEGPDEGASRSDGDETGAGESAECVRDHGVRVCAATFIRNPGES